MMKTPYIRGQDCHTPKICLELGFCLHFCVNWTILVTPGARAHFPMPIEAKDRWFYCKVCCRGSREQKVYLFPWPDDRVIIGRGGFFPHLGGENEKDLVLLWGYKCRHASSQVMCFFFRRQLMFCACDFEPVLSNVLARQIGLWECPVLKSLCESSLKGSWKQFLSLRPHCWDLHHFISCATF